MAICGRTCSFTAGSSPYESHSFTVTATGEETVVTAFGDDEFGSWVVCRSNGTVRADFYENVVDVISTGDEVSLSMVIGETTLTVNSIAQSVEAVVDAKGIVNSSATFRMTGGFNPDTAV